MVTRTVIMLIHPVLATIFVLWLVRQYGWRKKGMTLRGDERKQALARHQRHGTLASTRKEAQTRSAPKWPSAVMKPSEQETRERGSREAGKWR